MRRLSCKGRPFGRMCRTVPARPQRARPKGLLGCAARNNLGSAMVVALVISAQSTFAAEPTPVQDNAKEHASKDKLTLPVVIVTGHVGPEATEGTGSYDGKNGGGHAPAASVERDTAGGHGDHASTHGRPAIELGTERAG